MEQAEALDQPPSPYTQCTDAYPCLLRATSDPGMQDGSPVSPTPSYGAEDFLALQGPTHSQAYPDSAGGSKPYHYDRPATVSPQGPKAITLQRL